MNKFFRWLSVFIHCAKKQFSIPHSLFVNWVWLLGIKLQCRPSFTFFYQTSFNVFLAYNTTNTTIRTASTSPCRFIQRNFSKLSKFYPLSVSIRLPRDDFYPSLLSLWVETTLDSCLSILLDNVKQLMPIQACKIRAEQLTGQK